MYMEIIQVEHLTKDYGYGRGVFDVSFSIQKGEVFGFLGPNGAGKSTTIRHLMGFSKPDKGKTSILGLSTFRHYAQVLSHVGYIPGEINLPDGLTGWEFIAMLQNMQKASSSRLQELLQLFELDDISLRSQTKRMSLGVKRKLAIVVAFMHDPDVLILDEPTSGLDPVMQHVFIEFIKSEKEKGKTILLSSHMFGEVEATCDRIAIIKDGKIVSTFFTNDFKHATQKIYEIQFLTAQDSQSFVSSLSAIKEIQLLESNEKSNCVLLSINDQNINLLLQCLSNYTINSFSQQKETLENYFMKFYQEDEKVEEIL